MPTTGYDEEVARIGGVRGGVRPRWFKVIALLAFLGAVIVGASLALLASRY